jgi:fructose-specific phosphotransferase system IIB component
VIDRAEAEKDAEEEKKNSADTKNAAEEKNTENGKLILAVTGCPNGIAHTYMAAENIEKKAKELGCRVKVETRGSGGAKNVLTKAEIAEAACIIVAADTQVPMDRFAGRPVIQCKVSDGISKAEELLDRALNGNVPLYQAKGSGQAADSEEESDSVGHQIYKHLMNGVSHMLPFVIGGGIMTAIAFLIDTLLGYGATGGSAFGSNGYNGVCNACYGRLSEPNKNFHWGIIAVLFLTSKLTQNLLSSKHLLQTKSEKIAWTQDFLDIFSVDKANVFNDVEIKNITFLKEDVAEDDDGDLFLTKFTVNGVEIESPKELFMNEAFIEEYKNSSNTSVTITNIAHDSEVFAIKMNNIEISASLRKILQLVGSNEHLGLEDDINAVYNEFISLLNQTNMSIQSVHIEMILRALVRRDDDITEFPDFSKANYPTIKLLGVAKAIFNSPMLSVSLSYERHGKQLIDPVTYKKYKNSIFDNLYK